MLKFTGKASTSCFHRRCQLKLKVIHVVLVAHVVELQARENWKAAAHCADHFGSSMASRTRQPREGEDKAREEGRRQRKVKGGQERKSRQRGEEDKG